MRGQAVAERETAQVLLEEPGPDRRSARKSLPCSVRYRPC